MHSSKSLLLSAPDAPAGVSISEYFKSIGLERTNNKTGFMFLNIHEPSLQPWVNSLQSSTKPLVDLGACYGVHTQYALKRGRDVIALDADATHIYKLRERVKALKGGGLGRLIDARVERLPCGEAFEENSIAGALLSEVLHFLPLHVPEKVFKDVHKWLEPGGTLVVTVASAKNKITAFAQKGYAVKDGMSVEQAERIVRDAPDDIVDLAPGYMLLPEGSEGRKNVVEHLYLMTPDEVSTFAKRAGFDIISCEYDCTTKYPSNPTQDNWVRLVARKHIDEI